MNIQMKRLSHFLFVISLVLLSTSAFAEIAIERLSGDGVWLDPRAEGQKADAKFRVTVWFEEQLLGDGEAYLRRAKEFDDLGRTELRKQVVALLKATSETSRERALPDLKKFKSVSDLEFHWIVNGFSCVTNRAGLDDLKEVPGVRKIFYNGSARRSGSGPAVDVPKPVIPEGKTFDLFAQEPLWYIKALQVDRVWEEFGVTGKGVLNVVHDGNFIHSDWVDASLYVNPSDPRNGRDDDENGLIDDVHGFDFSRQTDQLTNQALPKKGNPARVLHGHQCVAIICGRSGDNRPVQPGIAPDSKWAGVVIRQRIEAAVEWAVEHGADTYSMSFSRPNLGEFRSHWRKLMEQGAFCGVHFVSGAGNFAQSEPIPVQMRVPEDIPHAVFAAAGVQRDFSRTPFSSQGPVEWNTEHYQDGLVDKPEVCAFNYKVPGLSPAGGPPTRTVNGNSFAGPMYCGAIALILSANPELKPWEVRQIITETATDVGEEGYDYQTGHGLINAYEAVKRALELRSR